MMYNTFDLKVRSEFFENYTYIVSHVESKNCILVDPAWDKERIQKIISSENLSPRAILITHHHFDHTNLAEFFSITYEIPIIFSEKILNFFNPKKCEYIPLQKEKHLAYENFSIFPLFTPGHTQDSICYMIGNSLFTGDTLFNEGCGICVGPDSSASDMYHSIQKIKSLDNKSLILFPGHVYNTDIGMTLGDAYKANIYLSLETKQHFIDFCSRSNRLYK